MLVLAAASMSHLSTRLLRPDVAGWILSALVLGLALRAPRRAAAPDLPLCHPWRAPLAVGLLALSTRLVLGRWFFDGWFYADETLAGCVEPAQFLLREPIWMGTFYISYLAYLAGYSVL